MPSYYRESTGVSWGLMRSTIGGELCDIYSSCRPPSKATTSNWTPSNRRQPCRQLLAPISSTDRVVSSWIGNEICSLSDAIKMAGWRLVKWPFIDVQSWALWIFSTATYKDDLLSNTISTSGNCSSSYCWRWWWCVRDARVLCHRCDW